MIDASSVLAWCFEDVGGPEPDALIELVAAHGGGRRLPTYGVAYLG